MSHPQPKLPSAAELIELHSTARVKHATKLSPMEQLTGRARQIRDADVRAQVARLR